MNIKQFAIKINDIIVYILFGIVFFFSAISFLTGNIQAAIIFLVVGSVTASIVTGYWALLSNINTNLDKIVKEMEKRK